jgi:DNA-binding transcriptional ArsR family regulator
MARNQKDELNIFNLSEIFPLTKVVKVKMIFRAINHDLRTQIMEEVAKSPSGELYVEEIEDKLDKVQSVVSQHLAILRKQELVSDERRGKFIYYSINFDKYDKYLNLVKDFFPKKNPKQTDDEYQLDCVRKVVLLIRAINHKLRNRIIDLVANCKEGCLTVTDIYIRLRLEQSVASQHLSILRRAGVLATENQGKFVYYSVNKDRLSEISTLLNNLTKTDEDL